MRFDELLDILGQFGKYQRVRYFLLCFVSMVSAWHSLNMTFVGANPENHCKIPDIFNSTLKTLTIQELEVIFIPSEDCRIYNISQTVQIWESAGDNVTTMIILGVNRSEVECPVGSVFSTEKYTSTIVSEFSLICDSRFWVKTSKSIFFAGRLVGAVVFVMRIISIVLAMVGKFCITGSYSITLLMAAESFPTVIRNIGMGMASMSARIGGILASLILDLRTIAPPLPIIIFGGLAVMAGLLALLLPETKGRPLPEFLEDVQDTRWPWASCKKKNLEVP